MKKETKKCGCAGCKNQSIATIKQNYGKRQSLPMCAEHAPQWVKDGKKQSPPAEMFGITQSWYAIEQ